MDRGTRFLPRGGGGLVVGNARFFERSEGAAANPFLDAMRIDFDSTWKDTTEVYFPALLELFEPQMLPRVGDHEPVSFLDQEMQELAQVLGDEGGAEGDVGGGGTVAAGSESQPYHGSRRGRRRARRSGRLRVDKLVRVPLPVPVPVVAGAPGDDADGVDAGAGSGADTDADADADAGAGTGLGPGPGAAEATGENAGGADAGVGSVRVRVRRGRMRS